MQRAVTAGGLSVEQRIPVQIARFGYVYAPEMKNACNSGRFRASQKLLQMRFEGRGSLTVLPINFAR